MMNKNNMSNKEQEILRQQPFHQLIKIIKAEHLEGRGAISGETYKLTATNGRNYKLRYCNKLRLAHEIDRNVRKLPRTFPPYYGREGRFLLFDWINGEHLTKPLSLNECYQIGKIMGETHELKEIDEDRSVEKAFEKMMREIEEAKIFDQHELQQINTHYHHLRAKLQIDITLDLHDVHIGNLMKDKNGRVYFIDEEGFSHRMKGLGLAKPLLINKIIGTKEQQQAFWKGYEEHHSKDYFDKDYQTFVHVHQLIRSIRTRIKTQHKLEESVEQLKELLKQI